MKHYLVKFKYADQLSNWQWCNQNCTVYAKTEHEAKVKAIALYDLGLDSEYQIVSVEEI